MSRFALLVVLLFSVPSLALAQTEAPTEPAAGAETAPPPPASAPAPEPLATPEPPPPPAEPAAPKVQSAEEAEAQALEDLGVVEDDLETNMEVFRRGSFSLRIGGMLQVIAAPYVGDDAAMSLMDPMDTEGFRVRRARLAFGGTIYRHWEFYLGVDLMDTVGAAMGWGGNHGSEILDAYIAWTRFPFLRISAGVDKVPFSAFALASSSKMEFMERPMTVRLIGPDRRVGITVEGDIWRFSYAAGVYNGSSGVTTGNQLAGISTAAHLAFHVLGKPTEFVPRTPRLSVGGSYMFDDTSTSYVHRGAANLDLRLYRVRLAGEFIYESVALDMQPGSTTGDSGDSSRYGAAGQLSVFVWRDLLQLAFRYEYFNDNVALSSYGTQQLFTGGLNFYLLQHKLKLMLNYIRRHEMDGTTWDNDIGYAQVQARF